MAQMTINTTAAKVPDSWLCVQNLGSVDVYLGRDNSLTTGNGVKLAAGAMLLRPSVQFQAFAPIDLWVVAASGTADLRIL